MWLRIFHKSLLLIVFFLIPAPCLSKDNLNDYTIEVTTDFTYGIGSGDSKKKYEALGLYGAKSKAVVLAAKYFTHKGLLENYGKKQKEIFCLAANELKEIIIEKKYSEKNNTYYIRINTKAEITDFIKAEIKNLELEKEEIGFSFQEEMDQHVYKTIDPAQELSRAYRYIRKRQWRIAIIYLDHLEKKYPNWGEIFLAKAIGFYGMHDMARMRDSLKTSCSLGNQEACQDLKSLIHSKENDLNK